MKKITYMEKLIVVSPLEAIHLRYTLSFHFQTSYPEIN